MADECTVHLAVEALAEGQFLATSEDLPGLTAQGRTVAETVDVARDVARKLLQFFADHGDPVPPGLRRIDQRVELGFAVGG